MRTFAFGLVKDEDELTGVFLPGSKEFEDSVKKDMEGQPCYSPSVYDQVMYETISNPDGDSYISSLDLTSILLNQEKYRRVLGDAVIQDIVNSMHPTKHTLQDGLTDRQRLDLVISRHCQSMSERQAVLDYLSVQHADLMESISAQESEQKAVDQGATEPTV
ncbi:hypothetical protein [Glycocaulis alkaliphilus]|uniref:hypothetical protein n=1 Tax=Glycocaulis alkaliphilus TaxID=1434191 RepID=UPI00166DF02E|nr:hypothetical protein [Glycocaulis alkaliphilus]GGB86880.1 hypothetical protein GCM10007417_28660 [Glycocaulis alkaliphilus]